MRMQWESESVSSTQHTVGVQSMTVALCPGKDRIQGPRFGGWSWCDGGDYVSELSEHSSSYGEGSCPRLNVGARLQCTVEPRFIGAGELFSSTTPAVF